MYYIRDLIKKKRNNEELTEDEIYFFIDAYYRDEILKEQAAALVMLMNIKGLSDKEIMFLSKAIAGSGEMTELYKISNQMVDIHPIGGMDDKIIVLLLAILSALNLPSIKVISRETGLMDKLLLTEIFKYSNQKEEVQNLINNNKIVLLQEPENIAPIENKLYKLRNDISCNDDIALIAISLMGQKLALGFRNIFFDISFGEKAYVKTLKEAEKLAKCLIKIGNNLNRNVKCIITTLNEPVGKLFGNSLELKEILVALNGDMSEDVKELIFEMGSSIIELETGNTNKQENIRLIENVINNKQAYNKLIEVLDKNKNYKDLCQTKCVIPIMSHSSGYIESIDMSLIRTTLQYLNAIRYNKNIKLDIGAGIEIVKKIGDNVNIGDLIGYVYTNDESKVQKSVQNVKASFIIVNRKVKRRSRIIENL